ncbi:hypothetical protein LK533_03270 [Sphingomonas sp. PL-96]|uniref:hypothetical protein n=1 Tax=Sphingomonas sp. PL-96 TaxID=2887201 RepID=UPI001E384DCD|nr:hypothetical protein [Sphingomonas sp. PL-96]MCC2975695.1 hypothetical protein [Sphingomonas sp. PL-96]
MADRSMMFAFPAALLLVACGAQPSDGAGRSVGDGVGTTPGSTAAAAPTPAPAPAPARAANEKFDVFWQRFRTAALAGDAAGIAAASAPKVTSHGILDSDATATLSPAQAAKAVQRLLASDEPIDSSRRTLRQVLASGDVPQREGQPLGTRVVGPVTFQQINGRWFLTDVYLED